jgi:hypothetical protein
LWWRTSEHVQGLSEPRGPRSPVGLASSTCCSTCSPPQPPCPLALRRAHRSYASSRLLVTWGPSATAVESRSQKIEERRDFAAFGTTSDKTENRVHDAQGASQLLIVPFHHPFHRRNPLGNRVELAARLDNAAGRRQFTSTNRLNSFHQKRIGQHHRGLAVRQGQQENAIDVSLGTIN